MFDRERELYQLHHGSGLGLWIVDRIANQSDGFLRTESNKETGNRVELGVPIPLRA